MAEIDVILPVRNGAQTLADAANSVLSQSFRDIRLIIVDDGSTDATPDIVAGLCEQHRNVVALRGGGGIVEALNLGLDAVSSRFVARMDADDISLPLRFERQRDALRESPAAEMVGTWISWFGDRTGAPGMAASPDQCRRALAMFNPFCHPTVLMRADTLSRHGIRYLPEYTYAEDYELFCRLALRGQVFNVPEPLLRYRIHNAQVSQQKRIEQRRLAREIANAYSAVAFPERRGRGRRSLFMATTAVSLGPRLARESLRAIRNEFIQVAVRPSRRPSGR